MSGSDERVDAVSGQVPVVVEAAVPAVRREGEVAVGSAAAGAVALGVTAVGALAVGALAVGAVAVGAMAIGRLAIGRLGLGQLGSGQLGRLRSTDVDGLRITRLVVAELRVERLDRSSVFLPRR